MLFRKKVTKKPTYIMPKKIEKKILKLLGSINFIKQISYEPGDQRGQICLIIIYEHDDEIYAHGSIFEKCMKLYTDRSIDIFMNLEVDHSKDVKRNRTANATTILKR